MQVAIIKYNAGNTQSVINALNRLGIEPLLTDNFEEIRGADKVIFPGVGEASSTMKHLKQLKMDELIPSLTQPVLGICLGLQLMCKWSEENNTDCLGIFDEEVKLFKPENNDKVPHMGWNVLKNKSGALMNNLPDDHAYFVHSYYVPVNKNTVAQADYINPFSAAMQKDNFSAVQFHPEKSAAQGQKIIQNFIEI